MPTKILPTKDLSEHLLRQVRIHAEKLTAEGTPPHLAVVLVGNNPASKLYVSRKQQACERYGIGFTLCKLSDEIKQSELNNTVAELAEQDDITGVILQLPLPTGLNPALAINKIPTHKDVDGLTALNAGRTAQIVEDTISPATPLGILRILKWQNFDLIGKDVVVIGRSNLVGMPTAVLLSNAGATVTICHKDTKDINIHTRYADLIVCAAGCPNLVCGTQIKPGAFVIDVGISPAPAGSNKKIVGDINCDTTTGVAGVLTPVPGGVGPMTVASLLTNIIDAAYVQIDQAKPMWDLHPA